MLCTTQPVCIAFISDGNKRLIDVNLTGQMAVFILLKKVKYILFCIKEYECASRKFQLHFQKVFIY